MVEPLPLSADGRPFGSIGDTRRKRFGVAVGMLWLGIPVVNTATGHPAAWRAALAAVLFPIAVAVYLWGATGPAGRTPRRRVVTTIAVLTAIGIVLTLAVQPSWALLFTYVAVVSGIHLPPRSAVPTLFGAVALAILLNLHHGADVAISFGASAFGIGMLLLALGRLIAANTALREAHEQIERLAVTAERERFARDLHDLLGHSLSVITLKAELAGRLLPDHPDEAAQHVGELEMVARTALSEVRETVSGYRRPTLSGELAGARMALDAAGIETRIERDVTPLPAEVEALLAWTVREGTTNVIRHSGARRCEIVVAPDREAGTASAEIRDDGPGSVNGGGGNPGGHGLDGLRERAAQLAGDVEAGLRPEGGFRLRVTVPLSPAAGDVTPAPRASAGSGL